MSDITKANIVYVSTSKNSDYVSAVDHEGAVPFMRAERLNDDGPSLYDLFYKMLKTEGLDNYYDERSIRSLARHFSNVVEHYPNEGPEPTYHRVDIDKMFTDLDKAVCLLHAVNKLAKVLNVAQQTLENDSSTRDMIFKLKQDYRRNMEVAVQYMSDAVDGIVDGGNG